jgi:hypothetical protein
MIASLLASCAQFWRDNARPHATRTLQRVPNDEMTTMQKLNEAMPTSDDPAPVLLVEDDDCSMFNKYKRTMLMVHFVNSNVDEMTAPEMKTKWKELLNGDDVVSKSSTNHSTFARYAPLNAQLCSRFSERFSVVCVSDMQRILRIEEILSTRTIEPAQELCALPDSERLRRRVRSLCRRCDASPRMRPLRSNAQRSIDSTKRRRPTSHIALYKHQDEQYRLIKDNLTDDHAMIVFDFSPYNATALQLTQEESRRSGMQVLHVVVIRSSTKARSTTTTGVFRSFVRCHFHIFATAGGNDLKFHYIDFVLQSGSTNDYAVLKTALVIHSTSAILWYWLAAMI